MKRVQTVGESLQHEAILGLKWGKTVEIIHIPTKSWPLGFPPSLDAKCMRAVLFLPEKVDEVLIQPGLRAFRIIRYIKPIHSSCTV
jgi:hypothetical protein